MAAVRIDSGPLEPTYLPREVPREKWPELVDLRRSFLTIKLNHDCRCLVQFVRDAEEMWEPLGYASTDDLIARGYDLQPEEIHLAVRWLELNEPDSAIPLQEVQKQTRADIAQRLGQEVAAAKDAKGGRPSTDKDNLDKKEKSLGLPTGSNSAPRRVARLKRDHPEVAERLAAGEFRSVAAAERAARGEEPHPERKKKTPLEQIRNLWSKLSRSEKQEFLKEVSGAN